MWITLMPCLGWQSQAATSSQGPPVPKLVLGLLRVTSLEVTSWHNPREFHMSSTCWFLVGERPRAFRAW